MDTLFTYYRAIRDLIDLVTKNQDIINTSTIIKNTDIDNESLEKSTFEVTINTDWIDAIDDKLDSIGKAIKQERQFIKNTGSVTPIEKVKSVSRESITHLAKHAANLNPDQEEGYIVPKNLYSVDKLTDYTVYENRFIYFLLCYIRDFIDIRYVSIVRYLSLYKSKYTLKKDIHINNRRIECDLNLREAIENDKILKQEEKNNKIVDRIENIHRAILSYLSLPLMVEVSKAPMIKQPIVVTNVMKNDQVFKDILSLFNYLSEYKGFGYTVKEIKTPITPFTNEQGYIYATLLDLNLNLSYIYANDLLKDLRNKYDQVKNKLKEEALTKNKREIANLQKRLQNQEISIEEYAVLMEKENKSLNEEIEILNKQLMRIDYLEDQVDSLKADLQNSNDVINQKNSHISDLIHDYESRLQILKVNHDHELSRLNEEQVHMTNLLDKDKDYEISVLNTKLRELNKENISLKSSLDKTNEENTLLKAKLNNYKFNNNEINLEQDFVNEEDFKELENELKSFKKYVKKQWKYTKKKVIKDVKSEYKYKKVGNSHEKD